MSRQARLLLAAAVLVLARLPTSAEPAADATTRAMQGLRAQWQRLAETGAILVARCERGGFHGRKLSADAKVEIEMLPGPPPRGIVRMTAAIVSNGSSPRANAIEMPGMEPKAFVCFETPGEARNASDASDFAPGGGRPMLTRKQTFEAVYRVENGMLVLSDGNAAMRERILSTFEPGLQGAESDWTRVMRWPLER